MILKMDAHVNVSDLKAHLSAYLARARAGETIVVCDRKTPIATIGPSDKQRTGRLRVRRPATRPLSDLKQIAESIPPSDVSSEEFLDREDRF